MYDSYIILEYMIQVVNHLVVEPGQLKDIVMGYIFKIKFT